MPGRLRFFTSTMTRKISLDQLKSAAAGKPLGYYEDVCASGQIKNGILLLEPDVYAALRKKYSPRLPSLAKQAHNIFGAAGKAIRNPTPVSSEERERRLAICHACEFLVDGKRCLKCGCHVNWKARLEAWHCPIEKW
jgi:hypothetical protein